VPSLQVVSIPRDWKTAKQDPWWREAIVEELESLRKKKTWELTYLLVGKKAISSQMDIYSETKCRR
jgi:hypothetical protein